MIPANVAEIGNVINHVIIMLLQFPILHLSHDGQNLHLRIDEEITCVVLTGK